MARTPSELLRIGGRVALWCLLLVLLVRGAAAVLGPREPAPVAEPATPTAEWPSDEASAFAVRFARAYLAYSPRDGDAATHDLQVLVASDIGNAVVPVAAGRGKPPAVEDAVVARAERLDDRHALVTVAVSVAGSSAPRLLAVPVARDAAGGLVVSDLPAFVAPAARAATEEPEVEPLPAADRDGIADLLERFLRPFLAGQTNELRYLVVPGVQLQAVSAPLELLGIDDVVALPGGSSGARWVLASVRARDGASGMGYGLRYRVRVVRRDRWLVSAIDSSPKGG